MVRDKKGRFVKGHVPWHKGLKGVIKAWNKGLTKKTDPRLRNMGIYERNEVHGRKISETNKRLFREGKRRQWNKGLTKEIDERVRRISKIMKKLVNEGKLGTWKKGQIPWNRGLTKEDSRVRKNAKNISLAMKGKPKSEEYKKNLKELWQDPEFRKKMYKAFCRKPNKPEKVLIKLIKQYNLPFKYVGDLKFWIDGRNPDFINCDGGKQLIEVFGEYWHNRKNMPFKYTEMGTIQHYKRYGFKVLIIWEHELKQNPDIVIQKVKSFGGLK